MCSNALSNSQVTWKPNLYLHDSPEAHSTVSLLSLIEEEVYAEQKHPEVYAKNIKNIYFNGKECLTL